MTTQTKSLHGDELLTVRARDRAGASAEGVRSFIIDMADDETADSFVASLPLLRKRFVEEAAALRDRRVAEAIAFFTREMLGQPSAAQMRMAQRLGTRRARVLDEFNFYTAEQLADRSGSRAKNRSATADNWRRRGQVFAVPNPDQPGSGDIFPGFQFDRDYKPLPVIRRVLSAFGPDKAPWTLALWFTSNNGMIPGGARPVDFLQGDQEAADAIVRAAEYDALPSAA